MSFDRPYLLTEFPAYDYNNPVHPWEMDIDKPDGPRNCAWQMQAFHYHWCLKQCQESGEIGLSLGIPNLPYCLLVGNKKDEGHINVSGTEYAPMVLNPFSFGLVVASSALQKISCAHSAANCDNLDVLGAMREWMLLLRPGGFFVAALMDEKFSAKHGRSLKDQGWSHTWSVRTFESRILQPLAKDFVDVQEFDTFKNGMSFNVVLRKKERK